MISVKRHRFIFVWTAVMDICWLHAWAVFILSAVFQAPISIVFTASFYLGSLATTYLCFLKSRIRISVILIYLLAFAAVWQLNAQGSLLKFNQNKFNISLFVIFQNQLTTSAWGLIIVLLIMAAAIWYRGYCQLAKPLSSERLYLWFDLGIAMLFLLLVIRLLLAGRFGISLDYPKMVNYFVPFLLAGLLAIGMIHNLSAQKRSYAAGFQKIGVVISFSMISIASGICFVLLLKSQLLISAESLSTLLKKAGVPLTSALIWIVKLLWGPKQSAWQPEGAQQGGLSTRLAGIDSGNQSNLLSEILKWSIGGLLILVVVFIVFLMIRAVINFFSSTAKQKYQKIPLLSALRDLINVIIKLLFKLKNRRWTAERRHNSACGLYEGMLAWGKRSGFVHRNSETLQEYSFRLIRRFPELITEISLIVQLIYQEKYGGVVLTSNHLISGRQAAKIMNHPVFWPKRFKNWLIPSDKLPVDNSIG